MSTVCDLCGDPIDPNDRYAMPRVEGYERPKAHGASRRRAAAGEPAVTDLASELLRALDLALELTWSGDKDILPDLLAQLDRVEQTMADAIDEVLTPDDEQLEAVA